jgi:hypothetical protein
MIFLGRTRRATLLASLIRMSPDTRLDTITAMIWRAYRDREIDVG